MIALNLTIICVFISYITTVIIILRGNKNEKYKCFII